mgnify:CR=1 FL=1
MAIQALSMEEVEVVSGGLVLLGLDVAALVGSLLAPVMGIVGSVLAIADSSVVAAGSVLGNVLASVNNTIVGLGL